MLSIPNYKEALTQAAKEFETAHKDIKVKLTFAEVAAMQTTLRTQLTAGTAPDIFSAWPGNGTVASMEVLAPGGFLMDLSGLELDKNLPSGMDLVTKMDGKRYILPLTTGAIGMIYNEQAVEAASAKLPTTWSEVLGFCDAAKAAGKVAFAYGAQTGWQNQLINYALTATLVYGENPEFDAEQRAGKATFSDSGWKTALEKLVEMQDRGCFQPAPLGTSYETATSMVAKGDALSTVAVSSSYAAIVAAADTSTTFKMFALPATDDASQTWIPAGGSGGYAANAKAKNPVAAKLFLDFLASDKMQAEIGDMSGSLPAIMSDTYAVPEALTVVAEHVKAGTIHPYADQLWPSPKVSEAHISGTQQLLGGQASIADVLKAMDAAYAAGS
ncbi:MAG: extracellular solute-binding protein [Microbacterium sp.]